MNYIERLNHGLKQQLRNPWRQDQSGGERVWFLVFDPDRLRAVMLRKALFQQSTEAAGKRWVELDLSSMFGTWISEHEYAEAYYEEPGLADTLFDDFVDHLVDEVQRHIDAESVDECTLLALTGTESLFGINKLSHITRRIEDHVPGRLLVFFPGEFNEPQYRFLDARDGWNYLAVPILPAGGR